MDDWLESQCEELRWEAFAECQRCRGREHGDCSDQCRYWGATAITEAEVNDYLEGV